MDICQCHSCMRLKQKTINQNSRMLQSLQKSDSMKAHTGKAADKDEDQGFLQIKKMIDKVKHNITKQ